MPAWCKGAEGGRVDVHGGLDHALKGDDVIWSVHDLVGALCKPDADVRAQMAALEAQRQQWTQKLEMTDDEWVDAAAWAAAPQADRAGTTLHTDEKKAWSAMDAIEQYMLLNADTANNYDANYIADALGTKISESGRLAYILQCLSSRAQEVQWAMCQPDIDAFSFKKLAAELRGDKKHTGFERFTIRLAGYQLPEKLKERAAAVKSATQKDPAYAKMFEISRATRKEWEQHARTHAALLDLVMQMDDARVTNSRRAMQGCDEKTWAAWKDAVGQIPAKKFADIQQTEIPSQYPTDLIGAVVGDLQGYLAAAALYTCKSGDKPDPLIRYLGEGMQRWPGYRGPRNATHTAILGAGLELDDRSAKVEYPDCYRQWFERNPGSNGGGQGGISAVKPQGDKVRVEFAAKMEKQIQCAKSKRTNRITQIRSDGSLVYETQCLKETTVNVNRASSPQTVHSRYTQGLKPGMSVLIVEDAVIAVWPKPGAPKPIMIGGVAVK